MNRIFTIASGLMLTALFPVSTYAAAPLRCDRSNHAGKGKKEKVEDSGRVVVKQNVKQSADAQHQWQSIGTGRFSDDIITGVYDIAIKTYDVEVEQSVDTPTLYRIVNPLQSHPDLDYMNDGYDYFPTDKDYYVVFDVSDPDMVKMPYSELGYVDEDGVALICSKSGEYQTLGYTLEEAEAAAGTFRDNIISFEVPQSCFIVQNGHKFQCNESGGLRLVLPGGIDYSVSFENQDGFCPGENGQYNVTVNTGADVPTVRYGLFDAPNDLYVVQLINGGPECEPGETLHLDMSTRQERKVYLIVITLDNEGMYRDGLYTVLYNPADNADDWQFHSYADFTDGLLNIYQADSTPHQREVIVQESASRPGYWRIVEPYAGLNDEYLAHSGHAHGHYIYLDVSNPMNVILEESPVGVYGEDYGDILVGSDYWFMVQEFGLEEVESYGIESGGMLSDGIITFNAGASLCIYPTFYEDWYTTNIKEDGSTGDFCLALKSGPVRVTDIVSDDMPKEYYNLQSVRVTEPVKGGIYILRQGEKTSKVVAK